MTTLDDRYPIEPLEHGDGGLAWEHSFYFQKKVFQVSEARLYEDLDIDSIDAVDMLVELGPFLNGRQVKPADFKQVRTLNDVVNVITKVINDPA